MSKIARRKLGKSAQFMNKKRKGDIVWFLYGAVNGNIRSKQMGYVSRKFVPNAILMGNSLRSCPQNTLRPTGFRFFRPKRKSPCWNVRTVMRTFISNNQIMWETGKNLRLCWSIKPFPENEMKHLCWDQVFKSLWPCRFRGRNFSKFHDCFAYPGWGNLAQIIRYWNETMIILWTTEDHHIFL